MAVNVTFNGTVYSLPSTGDMSWGTQVTAFFQDVGANAVTASIPQTLSGKLLLAQPGAVTAPAFSFLADADTGMYQPAVGQLALSTNGVQRLLLDASGNLTAAGTITAGSLVGTLTSPTITTPTITGGTITTAALSGGTFAGGTFTTPTINTPTVTSGTFATPVLTSPTITGNTGFTSVSAGLDIGSTTSAGTPFIDLHSSGAPRDYDVRMLASGGNAGADGAGILTIYSSSVSMTALNTSAGHTNTQSGLQQYISADATYGYVSPGANWRWQFERASGALFWCNSAATQLEGMSATTHFFCADPYFSISANPGVSRVFAFSNGWYWNWNQTNGDLTWNGAGAVGNIYSMRVSDGVSWSNRGPGGGLGPYLNISDERVKADIREVANHEHGLTHVCALVPKKFRRTTGARQDREETGFIAQEVQAVFPTAVRDLGTEAAPLLAMQIEPVVAALVNAVKELAKEVAALKNAARA